MLLFYNLSDAFDMSFDQCIYKIKFSYKIEVHSILEITNIINHTMENNHIHTKCDLNFYLPKYDIGHYGMYKR